jgi:N-acetyltransferase 10
VVARFNERFILSLTSCKACLVVDDELNILPISSHSRSIVPIQHKSEHQLLTESEIKLKELKKEVKETPIAGALVALARTLDQGTSILSFIEAISEKTLKSTVTLTAARGRGKSAALGVAIAAAVAFGYSNIFVTSPSPENLKTVFEFIFSGFDALSYKGKNDSHSLKKSLLFFPNPSFDLLPFLFISKNIWIMN